jgi:hypothetical protein
MILSVTAPIACFTEGTIRAAWCGMLRSPADGTHITVGALDNTHGSDTGPFLVFQPGEKGVLIAEWNEYTPSSGTDIAVTSNLATIA